MMSVFEYAEDIEKSVSEVLKKCSDLGIVVNDGDDMLDDEAITLLDNTSYEEIEDRALELSDSVKIDDSVSKQKLKKKVDPKLSTKKEFANKKKQMYKHKEKLMSNTSVVTSDVVLYKDGMTVGELASSIGVNSGEIVGKLFKLGIMATINNSIDFDNAAILVTDYNKELKKSESVDVANFEEFEVVDNENDLISRPPVVTIMGHVDHGKTTLLDYIRKSSVASVEAGGITQAISAYQVDVNDSKVTFIDTPGHAAFTEMRARGASITDIIIIIIAADDGIMPQTAEVIDHAKAAGVPIIVAINKIDKPDANVDRVLSQLTEHGLVPESYGGDVVVNNISAMSGEGVSELLESIVLVASINEYKANPNRYAMGTVIESRLDKHLGPIVTVLVTNGTLRIGDPIVVGSSYGKVRTLKSDLGLDLTSTILSQPVEITGISDVCSAGDKFMAFETINQARSIGMERKNNVKSKEVSAVSLDDLFAKIQEGYKEVNVILLADVDGSLEAIKNSLEGIVVDGVNIKVIRASVGAVKESDIVLAKASSAIVIGFNVNVGNSIMDYAANQGVDVRTYNIIYNIIADIEKAMKGMLDPIYEENVLGSASVRAIFKFSKVGNIAGCMITDGIIKNNGLCRVKRNNDVIFEGNIGSIQREKDSVKEVKKGLECGITVAKFNEILEGDEIICYELVEVAR